MAHFRQRIPRIALAIILASMFIMSLTLIWPSSASALARTRASTKIALSNGPTVESCQYPQSTVTLEVAADQGVICFEGTGYLAYHFTHVTYLGVSGASWFRMYPDGSQNGFYYNFSAGGHQGAYPVNGEYDITQICPGCGYHS